MDIRMVEAFVEKAFEGKFRKNGAPMAQHSLAVGRLVAAHPLADEVAILGGYFHDLTEDTNKTQDEILYFSDMILSDSRRAEAVVILVNDASYQDDEYLLPKADRKVAACRRWEALAQTDLRLALVKSCDVHDNRVSSASVSPEFEAEYCGWAVPLCAELESIIEKTLRFSETESAGPRA